MFKKIIERFRWKKHLKKSKNIEFVLPVIKNAHPSSFLAHITPELPMTASPTRGNPKYTLEAHTHSRWRWPLKREKYI